MNLHLTAARLTPARRTPTRRTAARLTPARRTPARLTPARLTAVAVLTLLMAGCASNGGRYSQSSDSYPGAVPDLSQVKDAVPKVEPLSASGNAPTYEVLGQTYHVLPSAKGYSKIGLASFYGTKFNGYATSSGERYDMYKMTAASTVLPLPTYVRVTNLENGRHVIVKVNDRGPFHSDRIMDLSYVAAYKLGYLRQGTARVKIEAIDPTTWQGDSDNAPSTAEVNGAAATRQAAPNGDSAGEQASQPDAIDAAADTPPTGEWATTPGAEGGTAEAGGVYVQVAALGNAAAAERLRQRVANQLGSQARVQPHNGIYRVQVGPYASIDQAQQARAALQQVGYANPITVSAGD